MDNPFFDPSTIEGAWLYEEVYDDHGDESESDRKRKARSSSFFDDFDDDDDDGFDDDDDDDFDDDGDDDFDDDDDDDVFGFGGKSSRRTDITKVDTFDHDEVMDAIVSGKYDEDDLEWLIEEALVNIEFTEEDYEEICKSIHNSFLKRRVRSKI